MQEKGSGSLKHPAVWDDGRRPETVEQGLNAVPDDVLAADQFLLAVAHVLVGDRLEVIHVGQEDAIEALHLGINVPRHRQIHQQQRTGRTTRQEPLEPGEIQDEGAAHA